MSSSNKILGAVIALIVAYYLSNKGCCSKKEGKTIETKSGAIKGIISLSRDGREFYEWLGIPYAKPPVGKLRFASPKPLDEKWDGVRDGSSYGSICAQVDMFTGLASGQEDCLFLNIHVPKNVDSKELLPVMFFIHGGYFACGSGEIYRPNYFMDEDVVLVTTNYRLASLGFLNTGDSVVRGNMGLKDQSMALKWVNENIASFGGDPKRVTIFGESAGAASVHFQMLSPMSRGLFHRGISQSGAAASEWATYNDPKGQAEAMAKKLKCPTTPSTKMVECLRNIDIHTLLEYHNGISKPSRTYEEIFVPTVEAVIDEETFLPDTPKNLLKSGITAGVSWLSGFNKDDGLVLMSGMFTNEAHRKNLETDRNYMSKVLLYLHEQDSSLYDPIVEFYYGKEKKVDLLGKLDATIQLVTDRFFTYDMTKGAVAQSQHSQVQLYYYNKTGPSLFDMMLMLKGDYHPVIEIFYGKAKAWFNSVVLGRTPVSYGVCHFDELFLLFDVTGMYNVPKDDPLYGFSKDLVKAWVSYASVENVENAGFRGAKFPAVNPNVSVDQLTVLEIGDKHHIIKVPNAKNLQFWKSIDAEK